MKHKREALRRLGTFVLIATLALVAACSPTENENPPPTLVATTPGVFGVFVGGTVDGPALLRTVPDVVDYSDDLYNGIYPYLAGGARPAFVPVDLDGVVWGLNCPYGLDEAVFVDPPVSDAWDASQLGYFDGVFDAQLGFDTGTVREYSDGTVVLSCAATSAPAGASVVRHVLVPGAGTESRFAFDVFVLRNVGAGPLDLAPMTYDLDDGADPSATNPWSDYGTIGAFAWATKGSTDTRDPAIGVVPLTSTAFEVDAAATRGDDYVMRGSGSLAVGTTTGFAMLAAVRGGFQPGDAGGKDAAMIALGAELAALDGGAFCAADASPFFVWTALAENGAAIAAAICDGYAALP
jgi:hypothetical protein